MVLGGRDGRATDAGAGGGAAPVDTAMLFGLPADGLPAEVRHALTGAMAEIHRLRQERDRLVERETRVRLCAEQDPVLAVLPNRHALHRRLHDLLGHAHRHNTDHTFAVMTLVGAGALRLCCGAHVSEAAMSRAVGAMIGRLRGSDMVASLGNFDLGLVLTLTGGANAVRKIDEIAKAATRAVVDDLPPSIPAHVAWGASGLRVAVDVAALIEAADRDLRRRYFLKSNG